MEQPKYTNVQYIGYHMKYWLGLDLRISVSLIRYYLIMSSVPFISFAQCTSTFTCTHTDIRNTIYGTIRYLAKKNKNSHCLCLVLSNLWLDGVFFSSICMHHKVPARGLVYRLLEHLGFRAREIKPYTIGLAYTHTHTQNTKHLRQQQ
jgi:hypothetical protein